MKKISIIVGQVFLCLFVISTLAYSNEMFKEISDLKETNNRPVIFTRPAGGYIALWSEFIKRKEFIKGVEYNLSYYSTFYKIVNEKKEIIVNKQEIDSWRSKVGASFSGVWIDKDKLLLLCWRRAYYESSVRIILSASGEILFGPDTFKFKEGSLEATLVRDSENNVYAVNTSGFYGISIMHIYPELTQEKKVPPQKLQEFHKKYPAHTFSFVRNPPVTITSDHKLLICNRLNWGYAPHQKRKVWHLRPDKFFYVFVDLDGNFISEPVVLDIGEYAFRKIPGIHLGGYYYASHEIQSIEQASAASDDMDLSRLPNGDIILSITGKDETGNLCVYQVKFSPEGKVEKPKQMKVVNPLPFPKESILPVAKVVFAQSVQDYLVMFGFDEEGNFYSTREIWKEKKRQ